MSRRADADILLDLVPENGDPIGNLTLMAQLSWNEKKYWRVREGLLEAGIIERGRGKGGSVFRVEQSGTQSIPKASRNSPEAKLYEPLLDVLSRKWVQEMRIEPDQVQFEITAKQGRKLTGGKWTRPDIVAVSVRTFRNLPGKYVDVWTFEVKPIEGLDITAVFEAASHASQATRSYALLQVPEAPTTSLQTTIERCVKEATRLRVGLITFSSESKFETWETKVEAPRLETAPERLDDLISRLSDKTRERIARWCRA